MRETLTEANGRANGQIDPAQLQTVEISDASRSSKDSGSVKPGLHFKQFRQYTTGAGGSTATTAFCGVLRHTSSDRHISYSPSARVMSGLTSAAHQCLASTSSQRCADIITYTCIIAPAAARQHDGSKRTGASSTARAAAAAAPTYGTTEETSPTVNEAAGASHFSGEYDSPQKGPTAPVAMTDQEHILHEIQLGTADLEQELKRAEENVAAAAQQVLNVRNSLAQRKFESEQFANIALQTLSKRTAHSDSGVIIVTAAYVLDAVRRNSQNFTCVRGSVWFKLAVLSSTLQLARHHFRVAFHFPAFVALVLTHSNNQHIHTGHCTSSSMDTATYTTGI
eukprot:825-Heterococcus_DN1.PRE.2